MRSKGTAAVVVGLALLLSACSNEEPEPEAQATPTEEPSPPPKCPLTGRSPHGVDVDRPAIAVKIENSPAARPQTGLERADVVFEEIVEGGITRFMAIYHCDDAKKAGPVRSARFDDPKIANPFTRVIAYSGANSIVERELRKKNVIALHELNSERAFFRVPPGVLEVHNLFADTTKLRAAVRKRELKPPREVFEFGAIKGKAKRARRITVGFNNSNTIEYRWKKGAWRRFEAGAPFMTAAGKQIAVANVLVQRVEVSPSPTIVDVAGNPSPDISLVGKGSAFLFRNGKVVKGRWKIKKESAPPVFRANSGARMAFEVGEIWIELVPSRKGAWKGRFSYR
jgi:hypothetical protein